MGRLVPEERISFGINPAVCSLTTIAEIRDHYNEVDCRLIAKEVHKHTHTHTHTDSNNVRVELCRHVVMLRA